MGSLVRNDVKYIIVAEEKERLAMAKDISHIIDGKHSSDSAQILASKIISAVQIINGF